MPDRKLIAATALGLTVVLLGAGYVVGRKTLYEGSPGLGAAVGAQVGCAGVFLMGRPVKAVEAQDLHALAAAAKVLRMRADMTRRTVTVSLPGFFSRTAVHRPGLGCTLLNDGATLAPATAALASAAAAPFPAASSFPALEAAVKAVFDGTNGAGPDTRAVVVIRGGRIAAERYADGFSARTPMLGWSATKSVASALAGILVRNGRLSLDAPAPVPEWRKAGDPRGAITLRQLVTMSSGLKFVEEYMPGSDASRMLFHERDMAGYAAGLPPAHAPGTAWSYSSGTANIVSRIVYDAVGGTPAAFDAFARRELYAPLGITSMLIEPDEAGTPVGSSYGYATARDWARFGLLYLNRGMAGRRRVLPDAWVDFTRAPTPAAKAPVYGAMFWLNRGPADGKAARPYPHLPEDMYMAEGHNGQFVAVFPSQHTVIVRLGWTPEGKRFDLDRWFAGILAVS